MPCASSNHKTSSYWKFNYLFWLFYHLAIFYNLFLQQNRLRYRSLKKRLIDLGLIQKELARKIGLSQSAMSERMNGNVEFTAGEMKQIMDVLGIPAEDLYRYFIEEMIPPVTTSKLSQKGRKKSWKQDGAKLASAGRSTSAHTENGKVFTAASLDARESRRYVK